MAKSGLEILTFVANGEDQVVISKETFIRQFQAGSRPAAEVEDSLDEEIISVRKNRPHPHPAVWTISMPGEPPAGCLHRTSWSATILSKMKYLCTPFA